MTGQCKLSSRLVLILNAQVFSNHTWHRSLWLVVHIFSYLTLSTQLFSRAMAILLIPTIAILSILPTTLRLRLHLGVVCVDSSDSHPTCTGIDPRAGRKLTEKEDKFTEPHMRCRYDNHAAIRLCQARPTIYYP